MEKFRKDPAKLLAAARNGLLDKVIELVEEEGFSVNIVADDGSTALHVACFKKRLNVVEYISSTSICLRAPCPLH